MDTLEQELHDFVGRELHELAWKNNYPLHEDVALDAFFESFRRSGAFVQTANGEARITLLKKLNGHYNCLETNISFDDILDGWKHQPRGSPKELYNAMYSVYDRIGEELDKKDKDEWEKLRHIEPRGIREKMETGLLEYFAKHHEHVLVPASREKTIFSKAPKIIGDVLADFPLNLYQYSEIRVCDKQEAHLTPCAPTLFDIDLDDFDEFDENYYPSESCVTEFFWGHYLFRLAKEKGYPLVDPTKNSLKTLVANMENALKQGREIWKVKT